MAAPDRQHGTQLPPAPSHPVAGMLRIGRSPARSGLGATGVAAVAAGLLLGFPTADAVGGSTWWLLVACAGWAVVTAAAIVISLLAYFRPVAFDPATGTARLGRATVPLTDVTAARREVSAGSTSAYLRYRFAATGGAWGRVLVAGRPIGGLRPDELRLLEQFVTATAVPDAVGPAGMPPAQRMVTDAIGVGSVTDFNTYSAKRPVGKLELLAELRGETPGGAGTEVDLPPDDALRQRWHQDDQDAESVTLRSAADTVRRVLGWATAGFVVAGLAVVGTAALMEESSGSLDSDTNDRVVALLLPAIAGGLASYLGYAVAGLASSRHAQRVVLTWLRGRDEQQVARGLPLRLLAPFLEVPPGYRLRMAGGWTGTVLGGFGLLGGMATAFIPEAPPVAVVVLLVIGALLLWAGVAQFRRARRDLRAQHQLAAQLGGRRLAVQLGDDPAAGTL